MAKAYHAVPKVYYVRRRPQVVIEGRTCHQRNQWCVHYKTEVCPQDKAFYDDGYIWFPISSITTAQVSDVPVYNLEVSGDNSYTANNAIVHNCTDISQAGKRAGIKKDSGTRSAVLWYTEEAIRSLRPRLLLQENVAALVNQQKPPTSASGATPCSGSATTRRGSCSTPETSASTPPSDPCPRTAIVSLCYHGETTSACPTSSPGPSPKPSPAPSPTCSTPTCPTPSSSAPKASSPS